MRVPTELMDPFSEMSPLFGYAKIREEHMSPHMKAYMVSSGMSMSTCLRRSLTILIQNVTKNVTISLKKKIADNNDQ